MVTGASRLLEREVDAKAHAQLLDKLVDNANDFGSPGTPIRIRLEVSQAGGLEAASRRLPTEAAGRRLPTEAVLSVANLGAPLPEGMRELLFASMVSVRKGPGPSAPHLGLGLHIARLITQFHRGTIRAENLAEGGVRIVVAMPLAAVATASPETAVDA